MMTIYLFLQKPGFIIPISFLSYLSGCLLKRNLPKVRIQDVPVDEAYIQQLKQKVQDHFALDSLHADYLVYQGTISNHAYSGSDEKIRILYQQRHHKRYC